MKNQRYISNQRGLPIDNKDASASITDQSGETTQLYYYNAGAQTVDAGQAAGTVVVGKFTYNNIKNELGSMEAVLGDTSLSFTSTALTTEKAFDNEIAEKYDQSPAYIRAQQITQDFDNGDYCVDYKNGIIYGKKASTQVSLTSVAYKYSAGSSSGSVSVSSIVPGTGAYSTEQGDFTATATNATTNIVLSVDSIGGVAITAANFANAILKVWDASIEEMIQITLDDFTWTSATKTLAVANCTGAFTFATGDIVSLTLVGPDKMRDYSADAQKVVELAPIYNRYVLDTFVHTNVANATPEYGYVSMDGYTGIEIHVEKTGGTDTFDVDYEASVEGTTSAEDWLDITAAMTFRSGSATADHLATPTLQPFSPTGFRYEITTAGGANDADFNIFIKRYY